MWKVIFLSGLVLGWLISAIYPPPAWIADKVTGVFMAGKKRVENKIEERKDEIKETAEKEIEKKFERQTLFLKKQNKETDD